MTENDWVNMDGVFVGAIGAIVLFCLGNWGSGVSGKFWPFMANLTAFGFNMSQSSIQVLISAPEIV